MKNKNIILIGAAILLVVILGIVYAMMQTETNTLKSSQVNNDTINALIENYDSINDYGTQQAVWLHIFKTCPYWRAYTSDQFKKYGANGLNLDGRYTIEADWCISQGNKPAAYLAKCNDTFTGDAAAYLADKCKEQNKTNSLIGLLTGALWMRKKKEC